MALGVLYDARYRISSIHIHSHPLTRVSLFSLSCFFCVALHSSAAPPEPQRPPSPARSPPVVCAAAGASLGCAAVTALKTESSEVAREDVRLPATTGSISADVASTLYPDDSICAPVSFAGDEVLPSKAVSAGAALEAISSPSPSLSPGNCPLSSARTSAMTNPLDEFFSVNSPSSEVQATVASHERQRKSSSPARVPTA